MSSTRMKTVSKLSSFILIAALAVTAQSMGSLVETGHAAATLAPRAQITPHCHHAGTTLPSSTPRSPQPVSYQCCLTGHDVAAVRALDVAPPLVQYSRLALSDEIANALFQLTNSEFGIVSPDPPGTTPLRV